MGCLCEREAGKEHSLSPICIGHLWVFENLRPEELAALINTALRRVYQKGKEVFSQGKQANKMFLIKAGRVKLSKIIETGDEFTLDMRKAGDFLGENMLLEDRLYPFTATCLEDTLACGFDKAGFENLVLENPNIGLQVIKNLSKRMPGSPAGWDLYPSPTWRIGFTTFWSLWPKSMALQTIKATRSSFL